jgi:hypothetical protein
MKRLISCFFVVLTILPLTGLFAQQKYALVIGNSNYIGISKLTNPVNDANDMAAALQSLGFTVDKVINGDLEQMETAVTNLKKKLGASRNSYGFFFYAGHGVQASDGQNYLIPLQANNIQNETHLRTRAVSLQFVLDSMKEAENELNMIVLDACRDNPFGWHRSGTRGLSLVSNVPSGSIVMYAAASGQKADDGSGRNGLFTGYLLNNLKTTGLSVYEVFDKTMGDVKNITGGRQDPELSLRFSGANSVYLGSRPTSNTPVPASQPIAPTPPQPTPTPVTQKTFMKQTIVVTINVTGDFSDRIVKAYTEYFISRGFRAAGGEANSYLLDVSFTLEDTDFNNPKYKFVMYTLDCSLKDKAGHEIFSFSERNREGHGVQEQARQRAIRAAEIAIKETNDKEGFAAKFDSLLPSLF